MSAQRLLLIAVLLVSFLAACGRNETGLPRSTAAPGSPAPDFSLKSIDGETIVLSGLRGKVVLLEFWATWCPPCRESIPELADLYREYRERGFTVLGVSVDSADDPSVMLSAFARDNGMAYPVLISSEEAVQAYGVRSIPAVFLIDKQGRIVEASVGYSEQFRSTIRTKIEGLL
ncbi:MAG: TlpA disulfide reductase family protein [Thermodesulfovibrionales bacterium]